MSRRWTILRSELFTKGYVEPLKRYIGVPNRDLLVTKESEKFSLYNSLSSLNEISLALMKKIKNDEDFGRRVYKDCIDSCENLVNVSKKASQGNLKSLSSLTLVKRLDSYFDAHLDFTPFLALPPNYEKFVIDDINKFLVKKVGSNKSEEYLQKLMTPKEYPFQVLEQINLAKIALKIKTKQKIDVGESLKGHKQKYQWLSCYNFDEDEFSTNDFRNRLKVLQSLSFEELKNKTENVIDKLDRDEIEFQKTVKELGLSRKILSKIKLLREFVFLRTYRIEMNSQSNFYLKPLLSEISNRGKITIKQLAMMLADEIETMLIDGTVPKSINFNDRNNTAIFWLDDCKYYNAFGSEAKILISKQIVGVKQDKQVSKIKGTTASLGETVKGKVRLLNKNNMHEFQKGEVLVATMTSPDFVPAMHKAVAMVTDEGGVLCHAAIVSREMNKPCITGTKIATITLQNGDLVEVNTKKGFVKIIKRNIKQN